MGFYSLDNRLKLAWWVKFFLIVNIILYAINVALLIILEDPTAFDDIIYTVVSFFIGYQIYTKLLDPNDGFWRKLAEILGSIGVVINAAVYLVLIGLFMLDFMLLYG